MAPGRLIILFLEGLSASLTDHLTSCGQMPNLAKLKNDGHSGRVDSLPIPYETTGILTSMTGKGPGEYGVFSFWKTRGSKFFDPPELVSSSDIDTPFISTKAPEKKIALVNIYGTHPVKGLNGYLVSYPMWRSLRTTYPDSLMRSLHTDGIRYAHDVSIPYTEQGRSEFPSTVKNVEIERIKTIKTILETDAKCLVATITLIERLSHFFWDTLGPESNPCCTSPIVQAYRFLDREVGKIIDVLDPEDQLLIFSEHGFGTIGSFVKIDQALERAGLLDWGNSDTTKSIAREAPQGSHGINLALKSKFSDGWIEERSEKEHFELVMDFLRKMQNPKTGKPYWKTVIRGSDLYSGSKVDLAPDIVVLPEDERYTPFGEPSAAKMVDRHLQTGWHRCESRWFFKGNSSRFKSGSKTPFDVYALISDFLE